MLRKLAVFFLLLGLLIADGRAASLTSEVGKHALGAPDVTFLRDASGQLGIEDVSSAKFAKAFQSIDSGLSLGYTNDVVWLRLSLTRIPTSPTDWLLEVTNPYINDLRLYTPDGNAFSVAQAGDRFPFAQRAMRYHFPVFALNFAEHATRDFYLRMESDSTLAAQLLVWKPSDFRESSQTEILLLGWALGMILMSLFISSIHWFGGRDPTMLGFSALTAVIFVFVPANLGLLSQFVVPRTPYIADVLVPWTLAAQIAVTQIVFSRALGMKALYPRLNRILGALTIATLVLPLSREIDLYWLVGGPGLQITFVGGLALTGWVSFCQWLRNVSGTGYFTLAHSVLIFSLLVGRLTNLGLLEANLLTLSSWVPGLIAFLFLVHIGIAANMRNQLRDREDARRNIAAAQAAAAKAEQMRHDQSVFFAFVAHELRSPLGVIVVGLQNLHNELAGASKGIHLRLERIGRAAHRMGRLVERHLTLQRLAVADFVPALAILDPRLLAHNALMTVQDEYPKRSFEFAPQHDLPTVVWLDGALVELALLNLLNNAAKYSPEEAPVRLEVFVSNRMVHFRITDHGPGVPFAKRERMFEVFKRASLDTSKVGFGVGLATVRRVAEVHGGSVTYADVADGGSVFTMSLPTEKLAEPASA